MNLSETTLGLSAAQIRSPKNCGQKLLHLFSFRRLRDLMANVFGTKHDMDNQARTLDSTRDPIHSLKISFVSEMTYYVSSGTLNPARSLTHSQNFMNSSPQRA